MSLINSCRRVRASDFREQWLLDRAAELHEPVKFHRKLWEFAIIAEVYKERIGQSGYILGFGVGKEPLTSWFTSRGAQVVATDFPEASNASTDWDSSSQLAKRLEDLHYPHICGTKSLNAFSEFVEFRSVDMNNIPPDLLQSKFDLTWSCGSFEHIGGLKVGIDFFCNQMQCLKPGGIAVHTTEYNYNSDNDTINVSNLCLYRDRDLYDLEDRLISQGDRLFLLDLWKPLIPSCSEEADQYIDDPPYLADPYHLNIRIGNHVTTSVVLIAERGGS